MQALRDLAFIFSLFILRLKRDTNKEESNPDRMPGERRGVLLHVMDDQMHSRDRNQCSLPMLYAGRLLDVLGCGIHTKAYRAHKKLTFFSCSRRTLIRVFSNIQSRVRGRATTLSVNVPLWRMASCCNQHRRPQRQSRGLDGYSRPLQGDSPIGQAYPCEGIYLYPFLLQV